MMIIVLYLKVTIKKQMISINLKNLQVKTEEKIDVVVIIPYPKKIAS